MADPIARVNARHSSDLGKKASSDEISSGVGPCIFSFNNEPPNLPETAIAKFDKYRGQQ